MRPAQPVLGQLLGPPLHWTTFMEARLGKLLWMGRDGLWVLWVAGVLALCENPEADVTSFGRVALKGEQLLVTFHGDPRYSQE